MINSDGATGYIRSCDGPGVVYHLVYDDGGVSIDHTPSLIPVNLIRIDGSPALTGHYIVDMLPLYDMETAECFVSSGRQSISLSGSQEFEPGDILGTTSSLSVIGHP